MEKEYHELTDKEKYILREYSSCHNCARRARKENPLIGNCYSILLDFWVQRARRLGIEHLLQR